MTCFEQNLLATLREEIGEQFYDDLLSQYGSELGYSTPGDAEKNPLVVGNIVEEAYQKGKRTRTVEDVVQRIAALKRDG